jgi:hypothetical protein
MPRVIQQMTNAKQIDPRTHVISRSARLILTLLVLSSAWTPFRALPAQMILGAVEDESGRPIAGAQVSVLGSDATAPTDSLGRFVFGPMRSGTHILQVRRLGYAPLTTFATVLSSDTLRLSFELIASPIALETVRIEASGASHKLTRVGFVERRSRASTGDSRFVTRAEFERHNPMSVREIIRRMAGFHSRCEFEPKTIVIDGVAIPPPVRQSVRDSLDGIDQGPNRNDPYDVILPANVEAIEAYAGPSEAPAQFALNRCVLMIWTRN